MESRPDLHGGCGRGLRASVGGLQASSSRWSRPPIQCTQMWRRRLRGLSPTGARRAPRPPALGRSRGREAGRGGGRGIRSRPSPLPRSTRVSPRKGAICSPQAHISVRPQQHPIPTAHGQADRAGASRPHRAAVGPGVQGAAAPQLEKASSAEGLKPEPRAWGERAPVLGVRVAEGRDEPAAADVGGGGALC